MRFLLLTLFTAVLPCITAPTLSEMRNCYQLAAIQKAAAEKLDQLTLNIDGSAAPVMVAYKGANEMVQAKYVFNPITKLSRFQKGKALLQLAVSRDSLNLETRFLRFSIQCNTPSLLNYNSEMAADKRFLMNKSGNCQDKVLKEMIVNYFAATNILTVTELKKIKN